MAQPIHRRPAVGIVERIPDHSPSAPSPDIGHLPERYVVSDPDEVADYLRQYPHLLPLLAEAAAVIPRYFPDDLRLVLEVFSDNETGETDRELFIVAQTSLEPEEALARLHQLDEEWWLDVSPNGPGTLVVTV